MNKKTNPTTIGLFIVTGLALGVTGLFLFSSSRLFSKTHEFVVYFDGSLNGLSEGAPVKYRGVTIGSVKRVMIHFNQASNDFAMPVILELQDKLVRERLGDQTFAMTEEKAAQRIKEGLRVSLQTDSLITGVLYVGMGISPNAPPPVFHELKPIYPELPTQPTRIQELLSDLADVDIKGLEQHLDALLVGADRVVGDLNMVQVNHDLTNALAAVKPTLEQYRLLGAKLNTHVDPVAERLTNSLAEASRTLTQLRGAAEELKGMLGPDSAARGDLDRLLEQFAAASQSIAALAEYLDRHPNALIVGREISKQTP